MALAKSEGGGWLPWQLNTEAGRDRGRGREGLRDEISTKYFIHFIFIFFAIYIFIPFRFAMSRRFVRTCQPDGVTLSAFLSAASLPGYPPNPSCLLK